MSATGLPRFRRPDGRVGTRNHARLPTVICASVVAERIAAGAPPLGVALPHLAGCGQLGPDMRVTHETLAAYCGHPNVGAVVVVALGCEQVVAQALADAARRHHKHVEIVGIQAEGGTIKATAKGIRIAQAFAGTLAGDEREWCDASELILSLKCGGSDYTSGLASNPTLGRVTDRLVDLGGSAVLGEIAEIMGAEHLLAARASDAATAAQLIQVITRVETEARALGLDIRGTQPSPGNIRGGLTTIEEKSLGATHKAVSGQLGTSSGNLADSAQRATVMDYARPRRRVSPGIVGGGAGRGLHDRARRVTGNPIVPVIRSRATARRDRWLTTSIST